MSNYITTLTDDNGNNLIPRTKTSAITNADGNGLDTILSSKYEKPNTGIPKTDLSESLQSSIDKADDAQPTLVSGTNIKTINNQSLLGAGNITIQGGSGGLPTATENGTAAIYHDGAWHAQTGYGYELNDAVTITWDGSTAGRDTFEFAETPFYKVSELPTVSDYPSQISTNIYDTESETVIENQIVRSFESFGESITNGVGYLDVLYQCMCIIAFSTTITITGEEITVPSTGIYCTNGGDYYFNSLTVKPNTIQKIQPKFLADAFIVPIIQSYDEEEEVIFTCSIPFNDIYNALADNQNVIIYAGMEVATARLTVKRFNAVYIVCALDDITSEEFIDADVFYLFPDDDGGTVVEYEEIEYYPYWGNIKGTINDQVDLKNALNAKQATLVSGTNIKTINNESILGEGNISISGASWGSITGTLSNQTDLNNALTNINTSLSGKQPTLVSGTNIKTINNNSILGSGDISIDSTSTYLVTFSTNYAGTILCDRTFSQILEAYNNHKTLIGRWGDGYHYGSLCNVTLEEGRFDPHFSFIGTSNDDIPNSVIYTITNSNQCSMQYNPVIAIDIELSWNGSKWVSNKSAFRDYGDNFENVVISIYKDNKTTTMWGEWFGAGGYRASGIRNITSNSITIVSVAREDDEEADFVVTEQTYSIPDVTSKADKVTSAINGNFAGLNASGNLTDSGYSASSFVLSSSISEYTATEIDTLFDSIT